MLIFSLIFVANILISLIAFRAMALFTRYHNEYHDINRKLGRHDSADNHYLIDEVDLSSLLLFVPFVNLWVIYRASQLICKFWWKRRKVKKELFEKDNKTNVSFVINGKKIVYKDILSKLKENYFYDFLLFYSLLIFFCLSFTFLLMR